MSDPTSQPCTACHIAPATRWTAWRAVALVAAASALSLSAAQARDISGSLELGFEADLSAPAQVLIELRNGMGDLIGEHRFDAEDGALPLDFTLRNIPDGAIRLRAGVFVGGQPRGVSPFQDIPEGIDPVALGPVTLEPPVMMGFATRLRCGDTEIDLGFIDDIARLRIGREVFDMVQAPAASGARYVSETVPETEIHTRGDTARLVLRGRDLGECLPSTGADLLPLTARGTETAWQLRLGITDLVFRSTPEEEQVEAPTPAPVAVYGDAGDTVALRFDLPDAGLRILLRDQVCIGAGPVPHPVSVTVEEAGQLFEGCGGDPMALLAGGPWIVQYAGGTELAADDGLTMNFADGRITGASGCNRYSGGLALRPRGMSVAGISLTRRACHPERMVRESLFVGLLRDVIGFTFSDDGRLHLMDSAGNVLISAQR